MSLHSDQDSANPKLDIGDDQDFEKAWWRVEVSVWIFLCTFLACAASGILGRGLLSTAKTSSPDRLVKVRFERVARFRTPSRMEVSISSVLGHNGQMSLWLSKDLLKQMGMQRVIPQPDRSSPAENGVTYVWTSSSGNRPIEIAFDLEPETWGIFEGTLQTDDSHRITIHSIVLP